VTIGTVYSRISVHGCLDLAPSRLNVCSLSGHLLTRDVFVYLK